jgi:hypothetical protein
MFIFTQENKNAEMSQKSSWLRRKGFSNRNQLFGVQCAEIRTQYDISYFGSGRNDELYIAKTDVLTLNSELMPKKARLLLG